MLEHIVSLADQSAKAADNSGTWLDKLALGGGVMVLGLVVVFLGLISLIIITLIYPKIAKGLIGNAAARKERAAAKRLAKAEAKKGAAKTVTEQKITAPAAAVRTESNDELVAVITAAVAASLGRSANGILIKSIERTGQNVPAWGARGRIEQVYNRF